MRKLTKVLAGIAVAVIFTIGAALPAQAADNDFTPSPNKFREYMLNVTSKVLKGAMPDAWKREQLANQFRYNHSWETLNAQFGFDSANPNYMGAPDSYADYTLRRMEMDKKGGFGGRGFQAPATKPSLWQKTANLGGGLMALTGFPVGTMLGNAGMDIFGGWFGFDAEGAVCSQGDGWGKDAAQLITGRDCSMWSALAGYLETLGIDALSCVQGIEPSANWATTNAYCIAPMMVVAKKVTLEDKYDVAVCVYAERPTMASLPAGSVPGTVGKSGYWEYSFSTNTKLRTHAGGLTDSFARLPGVGNNCPSSSGLEMHSSWRMSSLAAQPFLDPNTRILEFYPVLNGVGRVTPYQFQPESGELDDYQLECEVKLDDGSVLRSKGSSYNKESGALAPPACPSVPEGRTATNVEVREQKTTDAPGTGTSVSSQPTTPEYQDWSTTFPECGTGACKLDLIQKPKASCFDLEYQCADWFEDADKANKYQCRYGVKDVDLDECAVYAGLFKPGRVDTGSPYTDPETGVWSGGKNSVEESRNAMGLPVQNPADIRACDGTSGSGSFDPIRFIMRPIQCALEWAFVPRPAVVEAELSGGDQAWDKKPPKVIAGVVSGFAATPSVSGCSRSVTIFSGQYTSTITPLNACAGSWGETAANVSKVATSAAMVVLVVVVVRRQIAGMIGYGAGQ